MSLAENTVISNQLRRVAVGKTIVKAVVNQNPHTFVWFALEPRQAFCDHAASNLHARAYEPLLVGKRIEKADVRPGAYSIYNFLYVGDRALMFNIPARYYAPGAPLPKRHQLLLTLEDGCSLALCGSLGGPIFLFPVDADGLAVDYKPREFPSVLSDDFTLSVFLDIIDQTELKSMSVKAFLATKDRFPGLDNYILHEILWEARVHPKSKMAALSRDEYARLYAAIRQVFPAVIAAGGRDTEVDLFGQDGDYVTRASRNTLGKPCARCGAAISRESFLGGAVYYCPQCQPVEPL